MITGLDPYTDSARRLKVERDKKEQMRLAVTVVLVKGSSGLGAKERNME